MLSIENHGHIKSNIAIFIILFLSAIIVHAIVLNFIFPGYYDPLWPLHSDFYLPVAIANSDAGILSYATWPRPIGMFFFAIIGKLGLHSSIAAIMVLTFFNAVLTSLLIKNMLSINFGIKYVCAFFVYTFLLFSHPYFYSFYLHDAFSQLSYFFLLIGFFFYCFLQKKHLLIASLALFMFSLTGFLAKETFGGSALIFATSWFVYKRKSSLKEAAIPFVILFTSLASSFIFNFLIKSTFVTNSNSAYRVDLNPASVLIEWAHYIALGYNPATALLIILIAATTLKKPLNFSNERLIIFLTLIAAFAASLLPNSLLPDHRHIGYSWTGAYILFTLSFFLALPNVFSKWKNSHIIILCTITALLLSINSYRNHRKHVNPSNQWILIQETTQRNLLNSLKKLSSSLNQNEKEKILITGISFPFSPFHNPAALRDYFDFHRIHFDIVSYSLKDNSVIRSAAVKEIGIENISFSDYSQIWAFGNDGRLIHALDAKKVSYPFSRLNSASSFILLPEVAAALDIQYSSLPEINASTDGYKLLQAGNISLSYQQPIIALEYFRESAKAIPENPYPWYMAGLELEKLGETAEAKTYFLNATKLDPNQQNPAFGDALKRIENSAVKQPETN